MKAIIMAGGEGKRLRPISGGTPKPLFPLLGRPMLDHILFLLRENGFGEAVVSLGYQAERIRAHLGDGSAFGLRVSCSEEVRPLGTAGGVRLAWQRFAAGEPVLVLSGDAACDLDLRSLVRAHEERRPAVTIALHRSRSPLGLGLVLTDPDGRVLSFLEKPDWSRVVTDRVNTGIYVLSPEALREIPEDAPFDFAKDLFPRLLRQGRELLGLEPEGYWCDAGTPESYYRCCLDALAGRLRLAEPWGEEKPEPAKGGAVILPGSGENTASVKCRDRAALMRACSENLAGFGADFSDGLRLRGSRGEGHIAPFADREALCIEARGENAPAICESLRRLAEKLEGSDPLSAD